MRRSIRHVEGVPYYRHAVHFRLLDGTRVRWVRWSPGAPWVYSEVHRELEARGIYPEHLRPHSLTIRMAL